MTLPLYLYDSNDEESHRLIDRLTAVAKERGIFLQVRMNEQDAQQAARALAQAEQISVVWLGVGQGENTRLQTAANLGRIAYHANRDSYLIYAALRKVPAEQLVAVCYRPYAVFTYPTDPQLVDYVNSHILNDFAQLSAREQVQYITFESGGGALRIVKSGIRYVEALNKKIVLYTEGQAYSVYGTILEIEKKLGSGFFRCHRSYVVARSQIVEISMARSEIVLRGGERLPLAKAHRAEAKQWIQSLREE